MIKLNRILLSGAAIALAGSVTVPAAAQDSSAAPAVVKSSKKMKLKLYGQISRVFGLVSDGTNQQFKQNQNANTSSRMGIEGSGKINKDWSLRTRFEFELVGDTIKRTGTNQFGSREKFRIRHTDAGFSHKRLGAVWIGLGDTATNGASEVTLAPGISTGRRGGTLAHGATGVVFLDKDTGLGIDSVNGFFHGFDGAGRATRMRYDTPSFSGLKASVSYIDGSSWDTALRYSGSMGGTKIKGAVGYSVLRDVNDGFGDYADPEAGQDGLDTLNGSFSVMLPMGLGASMSGAWQKRVDSPRESAWNINPSIWYTMKATELGPTTVEYAFQYSKHILFNDDAGMGHGLTLAQVLANTGTDTFLIARYYDADRPGNDADAIWVIGGGFRARF